MRMDNPALAGVPGKPRCQHCNTLLADGRCIECPGEQPPPLMDESDDGSDVAAAPRAVLAGEGDEHPDDAAPDEAIGQQRGDELPIAPAESSAPPAKLSGAPNEPSTSTGSAVSTPRTDSSVSSATASVYTPRHSPQTRQRCGAGPSSL